MMNGQQQPQQVPLPGSYYGPPVPPRTPYHGARSRWCSLFRCLLWTVIALGFAFAVAVLIVWLVYRPTKIHVAVQYNPTLSNLNLTTGPSGSNLLSYNLTANVTIRNPNRKVGVYYDWLEAVSYYRGARFNWTPLPTFFQDRKNSTYLHLAVDGSNTAVDLGSSEVEGYKSDVAGGSFKVDMRINGRVRYKYGSAVTRHYKLRVKCPLTITSKAPETKVSVTFLRTECDVVKY